MYNLRDYAINLEATPSSFKPNVNKYLNDNSSKVKFNQAMAFLDEHVGFDKSEPCKHVLLVYEEIEAARRIELKYLKNQLQSGQTFACLVRSENIEVDKNVLKTEMIDNGIDVDALETTGQLMIVPISDSDNQRYNTKSAGEIIQEFSEILRKGKHAPTAGFGILASERDLIRPERLALQLELEKMGSQLIAQSDVSWICPYHVDDVVKSVTKEWMQNLVLNHDAVIYLPKSSNGLALRLA